MDIYNRRYSHGMYGTRNGTPQESGTYFYLVTLKYKGELQEIKGDVTLIR